MGYKLGTRIVSSQAWISFAPNSSSSVSVVESSISRLAVVGLIAIVGVVFSLDPALPSVPKASAWVGTVERGDFTREVRGPGSLVPKVIRWIPAASGGRVERIVAKPGVRVEPDTVLVEMSNPELAQQLEEARWAAEASRADRDSLAAELDRALLDAQSGLAALQSDAESARLLADAEKILSEKGIVSTIQYQQSELRAEQLETRVGFEQQRVLKLGASHEAQLAAQGARVEQAARLIERRVQQVRDLSIRAGMAGVLAGDRGRARPAGPDRRQRGARRPARGTDRRAADRRDPGARNSARPAGSRRYAQRHRVRQRHQNRSGGAKRHSAGGC